MFKKCHECTTLRDVNSSRRYRPPNKSATTFSRPESMSGGKNKSRRGFTRMLMWNTKPFHTIPKKKARVACGSSYHGFYLERGSTAKWLLWAPSTMGEHVLLCVSHVKQFIFSHVFGNSMIFLCLRYELSSWVGADHKGLQRRYIFSPPFSRAADGPQTK